MTEKRITKREMFGYISDFMMATTPNMDATPEGMSPDEFLELVIAFCAYEVSLLDKKHSKSGMTSTQVANVGIKSEIVEALADKGPMRATEIAAHVEITPQKCTALLGQLVKENRVLRTQDKKVVTFSVNE